VPPKSSIWVHDSSCTKLNQRIFRSWIIITIILRCLLQSLHPVFENDISNICRSFGQYLLNRCE
jgi:hypothetical protein